MMANGETNVVVEEEVTAQKMKNTTKKWKMEMKMSPSASAAKIIPIVRIPP